MPGQLYFQWQNEVLLKTIYPMREVKLRDFLVYFAEIDVWAEYKDKDIAALQAEVQAYNEAQAAAVMEAFETYSSQRAYFLTADVRAEYAAKFQAPDEAELTKINQLHGTFMAYLPKITDVRKEKYFVTQQEPAWAEHRAQIREMIKQKKRRIEIIRPDHPNRAEEARQLEQMENVSLPMVEAELVRLRAFTKSFEKIEARKLDLFQAKEKGLSRKQELTRKLAELEVTLQPLLAKQKTVSAELARFKAPLDISSLREYFSLPDVSALREQFAQVEPAVLAQLNSFRKAMMAEFNGVAEARLKLSALRNHLYNWQQYLRGLEKESVKLETNLRNMPDTWAKRAENEATLKQLKETTFPALGAEIAKLGDFYGAFEASAKPAAELAATVKAKEQELARVEQNLSVFSKQAEDMKRELDSIEATQAIDEKTFLTQYVPSRPVNVKDIVRWKVEELQNALAKKNHRELLEDVAQRFIKTPERFPLWLQYMVIHFSGMRYHTAHGSYASPRDLLIRLHTTQVEKDFQKLDDAATESLGREKAALYSMGDAAKQTPKLAQATEKLWKDKLADHLKYITASGPKTRRNSLQALLIDERRYELEKMSEDEALAELAACKDSFPAWAWKEIVRLTNLRVNLVTAPGWEKLTPAEEAERSAMPYTDPLGAILSKWKEDNTTLWREEHERAHRLIVTSAVCNETAEHCQHLRGHLPPGGLTPKAPWYMKNESENKLPGSPRPYFTKPKKREDFTVGASILWLRFVHDEPNAWQLAQALQTKDGNGLLPQEFLRHRVPTSSTTSGAAAGNWVYTENQRSRTILDENKQKVTQVQWLRWIHEATVAEVADTVDGPVVLTFETALPDDDPGLSSIGLFKHSLDNALFMGTEDTYNGSFVGFVPEGQLPINDLASMLDWNKILLREILSPNELEAHQKKYIRRE